jgi:hypothetical protein
MFGHNKAREMVVKIEGKVQWQVMYDQKAKVYIGVCPMLNLNAIGDTWIDFAQVANEAMGGLFLDLVQSNEFEAFMRAHGWHWSPLPPPGVTPRFDLPFEPQIVPELSAAYA